MVAFEFSKLHWLIDFLPLLASTYLLGRSKLIKPTPLGVMQRGSKGTSGSATPAAQKKGPKAAPAKQPSAAAKKKAASAAKRPAQEQKAPAAKAGDQHCWGPNMAACTESNAE